MAPNQPRLSERERTVLLLAADGMTDREMASLLGLSLKTVGTYWDRMRKKFKASSRTQVLAQFLRLQAIHEHEVDGLSRIFADFDDGVWVLGRNGETVYANDRAAEIFSREPAELKQLHPSEVVGRGNDRKFKQLLNGARFEPASSQMAVAIGERKGWVEWRASAFRDGMGRSGPIFLRVTDRTADKQRDHALETLGAALDMFFGFSSDAIVEFDHEMQIVSCCEWMRDWSASLGKPIVGHPLGDLDDVFLPIERWMGRLQRTLRTGAPQKFESGLIRPRTKLVTQMARIEGRGTKGPTVIAVSRSKSSARPLYARF